MVEVRGSGSFLGDFGSQPWKGSAPYIGAKSAHLLATLRHGGLFFGLPGFPDKSPIDFGFLGGTGSHAAGARATSEGTLPRRLPVGGHRLLGLQGRQGVLSEAPLKRSRQIQGLL